MKTPREQPDDQPRREKENMDEPQEEFIDTSSIPSHTKPAPPEPDTSEKSDEHGTGN
jgi:hypothetical protein